jgi:Sulfatase
MTSLTGQGTTSPPAGSAERPPSRLRTELRSFCELLALTGFAVAQPLFDVAGRSPDFFLFRRADRADILILVALVVFGCPLALWGFEALVGLVSQAARKALHLAFVAGLLLLIAIQVLKRLTAVRGVPLLLLALACGVTAAVVYARSPAARLWLRYTTPAPLIFALLFITMSPAGRLVLPGGQDTGRARVVVPPAARAPVVLMVFDEFPMMSLLDSRGRIDRRLFPNFARFAEDATWYRNTTGVGPFTPYAVPAMLTGRYPTRSSVAPTSTEYPDNLYTLLADSYQVRAWETVTQLCPSRVCAATAGDTGETGWRALASDSARVWQRIVSPRDTEEDPAAQFTEATVRERQQETGQEGKKPGPTFRFGQLKANQPSRFADFLEQLQPSDQPTLNLLHLLLPHQPWKYLPSGAQYSYPRINFGYDQKAGWTTQKPPVELARQRHLLQLAYTDRLVGEVMQRLRSQGLYDEALVILTADHGISFTPGKAARTLQDGNAHELMWVPLFVKTPQQRSGSVSDRNVEQVDLLPTIADILKIKVPWQMDGISAMSSPERAPATKSFFNKPNQRLTVDAPRNLALALRGVTDRVARPQEGQDGLFKVGPFAELVGRRPEAVGLAGDSGLVARLNDPEKLQDVDPGGGTVPALVSGALTRGPSGGRPVSLAVAVNGRIGAVGVTFTQADTPHTFATVVPASLFQPGGNRVRLYQVTRTADGVRLRPVEVPAG